MRPNWWSWCRGLLVRRPAGRPQTLWRGRPLLEVLEDRLAPSISATPLSFVTYDATHDTAHTAAVLSTPNQFDLYQVSLKPGDTINVQVTAQTAGSGLQSILRVFDASGHQVALDDQEGGDPHLTFQAPQTAPPGMAATYYIGISSGGDRAYDPNTAGSGHGG